MAPALLLRDRTSLLGGLQVDPGFGHVGQLLVGRLLLGKILA